MRKASLVQAALVLLLALAGSGWVAFATAGRVQAAGGGAPWGELLSRPCDVQLQFMDGQAVTDSIWYTGKVTGYDGQCITYINNGDTQPVYIPLSSIRQIYLPAAAEATAQP